MDWHSMASDEVLETLDADPGGLSTEEAAERLAEHGPNELQREDGPNPFATLLSRFNDALIYLLVFAAILSVAVGFLPGQAPEYTEAGLILAILVANGLFGFVQD